MNTEIQWGTCHNEHCDSPTPWDMAGIIIDDEIYCSPDCARDGLEHWLGQPETVKLHDPQFSVDRSEIGLADNVVNIWRLGEPAEKMIDEYESIFPHSFRLE